RLDFGSIAMAQSISQLRDPTLQRCIEACEDCHRICEETVPHCLQLGGATAEEPTVGVLLDCATFCQTTADFVLRGSEMRGRMCAMCAEVCQRCSDVCENFAEDQQLSICGEMCRRCAECCIEAAVGHA